MGLNKNTGFVLDVGSASVRLLSGEVDLNGRIKIGLNIGLVSNLRKALNANNELSSHAAQQTLEIVQKLMHSMSDERPRKGACLCTQAIRQATDSREFLLRLEKIAGVNPEVLSSTREGELAWSASGNLLKDGGVLIDLGGGSTEIIQLKGDDRVSVRSYPLGGGVELLDMSNGLSVAQLGSVFENARAKWERYLEPESKPVGGTGVLLGGTATNLAAIHLGIRTYQSGCVHGECLTPGDLRQVTETLGMMSEKDRIDVKGLESGRESIIVTGGCYLVALCEYLRLTRVLISEQGIRYGRLKELLQADF